MRLLFSVFVSGLIAFPQAASIAQEYSLIDAERFAKVFAESGGTPTAEIIEQKYLKDGTEGIEIFRRGRIKDGANMAKKIAAKPQAYQKALDVCLPGARMAEAEAGVILSNVQRMLAQAEGAATYILFGGNNSGGTASQNGLALGLEVICRFAETPTEAAEVIKSFVAHEIVHVYQQRVKSPGNTLLHQSLREGFADYVANEAMGSVSASEKERHDYGVAHEAELWAEFQQEMAGKELRPWMYGAGKDGRPNDLGYWMGKRIAEAYVKNAGNKAEAMQQLLHLKDAETLLANSGYNPGSSR